MPWIVSRRPDAGLSTVQARSAGTLFDDRQSVGRDAQARALSRIAGEPDPDRYGAGLLSAQRRHGRSREHSRDGIQRRRSPVRTVRPVSA